MATGVPEANAEAAFLASSSESVEVHLGVLQLAEQLVHLQAVGAQRFGLHDLPLILVAAELDVLLLGDQLHAAELVLIEGEQALVAQIVERFVEAGLDVTRDREDARIAIQHGVGAAIGGRIVADLELADLAALAGDVDFQAGRIQAVG